MISVLIIEDEFMAASRLEKMLLATDSSIEIIEKLDSVEGAIDWFKNHLHPDLVLLDIQLSDGNSFEIFKEVKVECPVIFATAYDEFAIKAFELNSIDYLLKPIEKEKLEVALVKYKKVNQFSFPIDRIMESMKEQKRSFKTRFLINMGSRLKSVAVDEIVAFYSMDKSTFIKGVDGRVYPIDMSLDKVDNCIDGVLFFRINRKVIVCRDFIESIYVLSSSRIKITLKSEVDLDLIVSSSKSHLFRKWLDQ